MTEALRTKLAHVVGSNQYVILDGGLEGVLAVVEGADEARRVALEIEARNQSFDFEEIWKLYPRKIGKKSAITWLKRNVKSRSRYEKLQDAVANYTAHTIVNDTAEQFILHFSTWVKRFEDWTTENMPTLRKPQYIATPVSKLDIEALLGRHGV
jgi:hypothetical protein